MRRPVLAIGVACVTLAAVPAVLVAQTDNGRAELGHYRVLAGDTSAMQIARRLCGPDAPQSLGAEIFALNRDLFAVLNVGEALHVPAVCPEVTPSTSTTSTSVSATSTTTAPTTTAEPTTTVAATTTTVAPTTTVSPATTTTAPATTSSTAAPTTSSTSSTTSVPPPLPGSPDFLATFASSGDFYDRFQLDVHFRDVEMGDGGAVLWNTPISGDHNHACESPATQRIVHADPVIDGGPRAGEDARLEASELFWWCLPNPANPESGHIMTGMGNIDGYTILAFSPHRRFDNARKVCWDVNLTDMGRKWFSVFVIPEAAYQANGQRIDYIDGSSVDERAIVNPPGGFQFLFREGVVEAQNGSTRVYEDWLSFDTFDKVKRYKHCLTDLRNGNVLIEQQREPNYHDRVGADGYWRATVPGSFPAQARVIFADDSYNPGKDEPTPRSLTWHWDNVLVDTD